MKESKQEVPVKQEVKQEMEKEGEKEVVKKEEKGTMIETDCKKNLAFMSQIVPKDARFVKKASGTTRIVHHQPQKKIQVAPEVKAEVTEDSVSAKRPRGRSLLEGDVRPKVVASEISREEKEKLAKFQMTWKSPSTGPTQVNQRSTEPEVTPGLRPRVEYKVGTAAKKDTKTTAIKPTNQNGVTTQVNSNAKVTRQNNKSPIAAMEQEGNLSPGVFATLNRLKTDPELKILAEKENAAKVIREKEAEIRRMIEENKRLKERIKDYGLAKKGSLSLSMCDKDGRLKMDETLMEVDSDCEMGLIQDNEIRQPKILHTGEWFTAE